MTKLTLTVQDIEILKKAKDKIYHRKRLSSDESEILNNFLATLPPSETILNLKFPIDESFEFEIFDIAQMWPYLKKWIDLFNKLFSKRKGLSGHACWISADDSEELVRKNIIITGSFIPSFAYSKKRMVQQSLSFGNWKMPEPSPTCTNSKAHGKNLTYLLLKPCSLVGPKQHFPKSLNSFYKLQAQKQQRTDSITLSGCFYVNA